MRIDFFFTILLIFGLFSNPYLTFGEFPEYELTENDMEWCDEEFPRYEILGLQWFLENYHYSIKARVCGSLYEDPIWEEAIGEDRFKKLQERSKYYVDLEIKESKDEALEGKNDPTPVAISQPEVVDSMELEIKESEEEAEKGIDDPTSIEISQPEMIDSGELVVEPKESEGEMEETIPEELPQKEEVPKNGGGCLIATATFDSELAPQVQFLREIRENVLYNTNSGKSFMVGFNQIYYLFSPTIADWERENSTFKEFVKITITPLLISLGILDYFEINSELEMIGIGTALISLNVVMYFGIPTLITIKRKKIRKLFF